jgi:hypothetical protein
MLGISSRPVVLDYEGRHTTRDQAVDNAIAVRDAAARLIADVYAGTLHPRIAAGLAPLMNLQLHAIKTADLEQRLTKLEKLLKLSEDTSDEPGTENYQEREFQAASGEVGETVD